MSAASSVASVEQYKSALLALRDKNLPSSHFAMLRAQCRAPDTAITATQLAEAVGYESYHAANLQYGTLAFNLAGILGFTPQLMHRDGSLCWWTTLSVAGEGAAYEDAQQFHFVMRPELVQALREMRWA
ncbi:hypothetical protein GPY61_30000 [Massilia sp. NEAU-DD11]|uniref:Uncharacterized protein n=1 Tax=Massilia cellulosiltytica TaxID=2683234 RepID=A0A7X3KBK7_9BURK|nr:hypothetical protein [Telluria cellulosilytica]MVW64171.1 hypothetical protein [Telluria cellulosilytica]